MSKAVFALGIVLPALVSAGCSNSRTQPEITQASVVVGSPEVNASGEPTLLPLLGAEERWILREAHSALVAQCMREAGFDGYVFFPAPFPVDRTEAPTEGIELRIAAPDQTSFGLVEAMRSGPSGPPPNEYFDSLSPDAQERYADALYGSGAVETVHVNDATATRPQDGCLTIAENTLYMDEEYFSLESQRSVLIAGIGTTVLSDTEFQNLLSEYGSCMQSEGFDASAPWAAWELVSTAAAGSSTVDPVAFEIEVATSDRVCQLKIDYASRSMNIYSSVVQAASEANPTLKKLLDIEKKALARSDEIL